MIAQRRLNAPIHLSIPTCHIQPMLLLIGVLTLALLVGVSASVLAGRARTLPPEDFLSLYADLLPGQPVTALQHYRCQVPEYIQTTLAEGKFYCEIHIADGPVRQVNVSGIGETIDIFSVALRDSGLTSGDLTHWWGAPDDVTIKRPYYTMRWQKGVSIVGMTETWSPYQSGVMFLSLHYLHAASA